MPDDKLQVLSQAVVDAASAKAAAQAALDAAQATLDAATANLDGAIAALEAYLSPPPGTKPKKRVSAKK